MSTGIRVFFTRKGQVGLHDGDKACRLQEIRFIEYDDMNKNDFELVVRSLRKVRAWETIEQVVVEDCRSLAYGEALEVVGKEKLCYSK